MWWLLAHGMPGCFVGCPACILLLPLWPLSPKSPECICHLSMSNLSIVVHTRWSASWGEQPQQATGGLKIPTSIPISNTMVQIGMYLNARSSKWPGDKAPRSPLELVGGLTSLSSITSISGMGYNVAKELRSRGGGISNCHSGFGINHFPLGIWSQVRILALRDK